MKDSDAINESRDLRAQILGVAKEMFARQGYHGLSMREIAEAVGVSKAALYYHFKDKEQLFLAILDSYLSDIGDLIDQITRQGGDSRMQIYGLILGILSQPAEQRGVIRLASQEMAQLGAEPRRAFNRAYHEKFIDKIQAILKAGMLRGELRSMDTSLATWMLLGMMFPYFYPAHLIEMSEPAAVIEAILSVYMDGLAA